MQAINATVRNPLFALSFFGAAVALVGAVALHAGQRSGTRFLLIALAAALYLVGGLGLTLIANVPLNEQLAAVTSTSPGALAEARAAYEESWNTWNHVRTACSTAALLALVAACIARG